MAKITVSRHRRSGVKLIWQLFLFVILILVIAAAIAKQHVPIDNQGVGNIILPLNSNFL